MEAWEAPAEVRTSRWMAVPLLFATSAAGAEDYAVGARFGFRSLQVCEVSASGEIRLHGQTPEATGSELVRMDASGRFAVTVRGPDPLNVWRLETGGHLAIAGSAAAEGRGYFTGDVALSQDGRMTLVTFVDAGVTPMRIEYWSFIVNNRLEPRATPGRLALTPALGRLRMGLSATRTRRC